MISTTACLKLFSVSVGKIRTMKILILTLRILSGVSFMRTKLIIFGEPLFIGFIITAVIVFISVPAIVITSVSIIWTILVIKIRLTVSRFC